MPKKSSKFSEDNIVALLNYPFNFVFNLVVENYLRITK